MFALIAVISAVYLVYTFYWKRRHLPDGPVPLPLIGNLLTIAAAAPQYTKLLQLSKKYNGMFTFWLAERPIVFVCDYKLIRKAFVEEYSEALSGRFYLEHFVKICRGGLYGIVEIDGDRWKEQRKFVVQVFKNFGVGSNLMQQKILDEVNVVLDRINESVSKNDGVCNVISIFDACIGSVINNLIFGYSFTGPRLKEFEGLKENIRELFIQVNKPTSFLFSNYTWIRHLPFFKPTIDHQLKLNDKIFSFLEAQIAKHEKKIDLEEPARSEPSDFCEAYLREIHRQRLSNNSLTRDYYSLDQLKNVCFDLWIAGLESTSTTCQFAVIYLLNHPAILARVQKEIDSVVPSKGLVTYEDRVRLPYTQAVLSETQRTLNVLMLNVMRRTLTDIEIDGFLIKKGTIIAPQISCVLYDEKVFPDPLSFKPERFLNEDGSCKKIDEFVPFSVGKRSCLGESLAKMEIFLVLTNVLKHFEIFPEVDGHPPSMDKKWGVTVQPHFFNIRVKPRD